jgi:C4-dicarboxylate-specific signal transduction histidine kinase
VLINLTKNAKEAGADAVKIRIRNKSNRAVITLCDNGHGFLNTENLFVPLFTTKPDGQGIGLSFCRNIIEQHQGTIHLANNEDRGVTVTLSLPTA